MLLASSLYKTHTTDLQITEEIIQLIFYDALINVLCDLLFPEIMDIFLKNTL